MLDYINDVCGSTAGRFRHIYITHHLVGPQDQGQDNNYYARN